eukprot:TRINITY_DN2952_c0_g1_i2.p1 TRINITY_DN2952_c0_g1~~TRINITY_DN2952_c0_g1_i2.p1  ORF type:complete len:336 (+),score=98.91 TRINITY_DN2952_c0_g1_i2:113-1120(+)
MRKALSLRPGVVVGDDVTRMLEYAKTHGFAIPSFVADDLSFAELCIEAAAQSQSPLMLELPAKRGADTAIRAAVAVRQMAESAGVPVLLHTSHSGAAALPWLDSCVEASELYWRHAGQPLFSSFTLDLSGEPVNDSNIQKCLRYHHRLAPMKATLEMELPDPGSLGLDGCEDVYRIWSASTKVSPRVTIAAVPRKKAPGIDGGPAGLTGLVPEVFGALQAYIRHRAGLTERLPLNLAAPDDLSVVEGAGRRRVRDAIRNGLVRVGIDLSDSWRPWARVGRVYSAGGGGYGGFPVSGREQWKRRAAGALVPKIVRSFEKVNCKGRLAGGGAAAARL